MTERMRNIFAAMVPVTVAGTPIMLQPALVQAMVAFLGFSEVKAGYVASVELAGLTLAAVFFAFLGPRLNWRMSMAAALVLILAGNLASLAGGPGSGFVVARFLAGAGAGLASAIGFAAIAGSRHPTRNFGWTVALIILYSAIFWWLVPEILARGGYGALIAVYSVCTALCLPLVRWLLNHREAGEAGDAAQHSVALFTFPGIASIASILIFFVGFGAAWTYMALIGLEDGLTERQVSQSLSISQFFGVAGALLISYLAGRVGQRRQAVIFLLMGAVGILAFAGPQGPLIFFALNCLFQFTWNAGQPLILGILANRDGTGALVRFAIPCQYVGLTAGPAMAAYLLDLGAGYSGVMLASAGLAAASLAAIIPILHGRGEAISHEPA